MCHPVLQALHTSWQPWCNSRRISRYSLCDSHDRCSLCVCGSVRTCVSSWTQSGRFQPTLPLNLKSTRAVQTSQQQGYTTSSESHIRSHALYVHVCTKECLCSPFSTCDTPGVSSQPYPEGKPCIYTYEIGWLSR